MVNEGLGAMTGRRSRQSWGMRALASTPLSATIPASSAWLDLLLDAPHGAALPDADGGDPSGDRPVLPHDGNCDMDTDGGIPPPPHPAAACGFGLQHPGAGTAETSTGGRGLCD
eukprot:6684575-Alexandrium_andersonii.AAC.1